MVKVERRNNEEAGFTQSQCLEEVENKDKYTEINSSVYVKTCLGNSDKWAAAMKTCRLQGYHLPTTTQLKNIANALYKGMNASESSWSTQYPAKDENDNYYTIGSNQPLPKALLGLDTTYFFLWSGNEYEGIGSQYSFAHSRKFDLAASVRYSEHRSLIGHWAICVAD